MTHKAVITLLLFSPLLQAQDSQITNTPFPHVAHLVALDKKIVRQNGWQHEVYLDKTKRFRNKMLGNWFGVPQLFIFDKNMKVVLHNYGYKNGDIEKIEKIIKQLAENIARSG